ncbi:VOC family protein [Stackebrandtia nassauensis]|uniref:3-demethylubiquinone-9 3-methyltransferase n=1 Tax=Stackebrandtia nassauensis (strain DSM 44728 / CIP 108903 / NRRL B-16338 / NBRC 102104 / LLR-40K-21) TaxID=446470 RepID=D3Q1A0_STANL|nr:VOC family protein [Stackebrandtia nassauensis]ADD45680.1 3-demethylubiquinone-9 3-methyltransferase [Stackebrandtia nassauensis DSM 44728]
MKEVTPFLWFDTQAEEAATFYTSLFDDGKITKVLHYGSAGPGESGSVMTVDFELAGQKFMALNAGPQYRFNESVSFLIHCDTQEEVNRYWSQLTEGGEPRPCGWLKDKYGLFWQIVPKLLFTLRDDPDQVKGQAVMAAMLNMGKIESAELQRVYDNA